MKKYLFLVLIFLYSQGLTGQQKYTAYLFLAEDCPVCNYICKSLNKISIEFQHEVKFVAVFPQKRSNYKTASLFKKKYGLTLFTVELDEDQSITRRLDASVTPEVIVVDESNKVLYQGRVNNSYAAPGRMRHGKVKEDLQLALEKIVVGQTAPTPWPAPIGCYITKRHG